jgi:hypothetical protein
MARGASFEYHIWILEIWAVVNARTILQEEAILASSALTILGSITTCAIRMTLDAHIEVSCSSNRLSSLKIPVLSIAFNDRIVTIVHAISRRIENFACVAGEAC